VSTGLLLLVLSMVAFAIQARMAGARSSSQLSDLYKATDTSLDRGVKAQPAQMARQASPLEPPAFHAEPEPPAPGVPRPPVLQIARCLALRAPPSL